MKVAIIVRSTLHTVKGGDTYQVISTAEGLRKAGNIADIKLTTEKIAYDQYDLLHFFNIIRPADILYHIHKTNKPFAVSPILVDYSEFDKYHRKGIAGVMFRFLSSSAIEYVKTLSRWLFGRDSLKTKSYIWLGQNSSINKILKKAAIVLPNSVMEHESLVKKYKDVPGFIVVPNGVDPEVFHFDPGIPRDP